MKLTSIGTTGQKSSITASDEVFAAPVNNTLLAQAVRVYLSNQRQGTSLVQTRSEVTRTKKKWFRQKGTGNARHGARTPNIFVGGGVSHGPTGLENWNRKLTKVLKRKALISALSAQKDQILVSDSIKALNGRTKEAAILLRKIVGEPRRILIILEEFRPEVVRSLRNLDNVLMTKVSRVNALEIVSADVILMSKDAVKALEVRLTVKKAETKEEKPVEVKKEVKKPAIKKATTKKPAAKKAMPDGRQAPAKAASKKPVAKKSTAKKSTTTKKTAAKKK